MEALNIIDQGLQRFGEDIVYTNPAGHSMQLRALVSVTSQEEQLGSSGVQGVSRLIVCRKEDIPDVTKSATFRLKITVGQVTNWTTYVIAQMVDMFDGTYKIWLRV